MLFNILHTKACNKPLPRVMDEPSEKEKEKLNKL